MRDSARSAWSEGMRGSIVILAAIAAWSGAAFAADPPVIGMYEYGPIGAPRSTGKMVIEVTVMVNGKPVTKTVTIPSGDIKPYPASGICDPKDADRVCAQKIADARGAASVAKSMVIAAAINKAFETEFMRLGMMVTVGNTVQTKTVQARGMNFPNIMATYGALVIPGVPENQVPITFKENGVMGEGGNGGRFIPPSGASPGQRGSLDRAIPGVETVSTGYNSHDYPSEVDFGVVGDYIAEITPAAGMTDAEVLQELAGLLDSNGVPTVYDPTTVALSLYVSSADTIDWGNTDTGLNFNFSMEGLATPALPVPEPAPSTLIGLGGAGFLLLMQFRRRQLGGWARASA